MMFDDRHKEYSKDVILANAAKLFHMHESNYSQLLDPVNLEGMIADADEVYLEEICINIPSILIILDRQKEALDLMDKIEMICSNHQMEVTKAKIILM